MTSARCTCDPLAVQHDPLCEAGKEQADVREKRCSSCGGFHPDQSMNKAPDDAEERFRMHRYTVPLPPVPTTRWDTRSWIKWITHHGRWL